MPFFQSKPFTIEALNYDGNNGAAVKAWVNSRAVFPPLRDRDAVTWFVTKGMTASSGGQAWRYIKDDDWDSSIVAAVYDHLHDTWVGVRAGDWIIMGSEGEFYPVDPKVFALKYEPV